MMPSRLPMLDPMMGAAPAPAPGAPAPGGMPAAPPMPGGMDPEMMRQIAQLRLIEKMNDGLPVGTTTPNPSAPPQTGGMRRGGV